MKLRDIQKIKVGSNDVKKIYKGTDLVWEDPSDIVTIINTITGGNDTSYVSALSTLVIAQGGAGTGSILDMLNQLSGVYGGLTNHTTNIAALNDISTQNGGSGTHTTELSAWSELSSVLNQWTFPKLSDLVSLFNGNIVGAWPLEDTTGSTVDDISDNNNAAYAGTVSLNQKEFNKTHVNFGGTGNLNLYSAGLLSDISLTEGTLFFKIKANSEAFLPTSTYLFSINIDGTSNRFFVSITGLSININHIAGGVSKFVSIDNHFGGKWVAIAIRWSNSSGKVELFINGLICNTGATGIGTFVGTIPSTGINLFAYNSTGTGRSNVSACDVMLINRAATDSEISQTIVPDGIIMFEGDSQSNAKGWTLGAMRGLKKMKYGYSNSATSGATVTTITNRLATISQRILAGKTNILVVLIGVNNSASTAAQIYDMIKNYCIAARSAGWNKIVICTEIDGQSATLITNGWPTKYIELNNLIKADYSFADIVADLGARSELQNAANTTYFEADKIHINATAAGIVREVVSNALALI